MAKGQSESVASVTIDTSNLKELAAVLRRAQPLIKRELYKDLRAGAEIVAEQARFESLWSSRIPGSIKVQGSALHLQVVARGSIAPEASPLENHGQRGTFRHPVFAKPKGTYEHGTWPGAWTVQDAHPFLAPALEARFSQVVELVNTAVDDALVAAGFNR